MANLDTIIKKIVMIKAFQENGYWVKNISRPTASSIENTVVELAFGDKVIAHITFSKLGVTIDNKELEQYENDISKFYRRELFKLTPELKEDYNAKVVKIEEEVAAYRQQLIDSLNAKGFLQELRYLSLGRDTTSIQSRVFEQCHAGGLAPIVNDFNTSEREIKPGEIYFADLSPALAEEVSGRRPVLVLKTVGQRVNIVPLSSQLEEENYDDESILILASDSGLGKDGRIIISNIDTIHKSRLFARVGEVSEEKFNEIVDGTIQSLSNNRTYSDISFDDIGELEDEDFFDNLDVFPTASAEKKVEEDISFVENVDNYIDPTLYDKEGREKFPVTLEHSKYVLVREPEEVKAPEEKPAHSPVEDGRVINIDEIYAGHEVHFELSDEELISLAKLYEESRPRIVFDRRKVLNGELSLGVSVNYNEGLMGSRYFPIELRFTPFAATAVVGTKTIKQERVLTKGLVELLTKKYPDHYPPVYAAQAVKFYQRFYNMSQDAELAGQRLSDALALIGRKVQYPDKVCQKQAPYGFGDFMVKMDEEFPEVDLSKFAPKQQEPEVKQEEKPKVRTLIREVPGAPIVITPEEVRAAARRTPAAKAISGYSTEGVAVIKDYTLSEDDVRRIGEIKVELSNMRGSKKKFAPNSLRVSDWFVGKTLRDDRDPVMLYYNEGILGDGYFHTEMGIYLFHGSFWCGDKGSNFDADTQAAIAMVMSELYPDRYPRDYAKHYIKHYNKMFNIGKLNITQACEGLDRALTFIGKRSNHTSDLIMNDPRYFMFEDLITFEDEGEN